MNTAFVLLLSKLSATGEKTGVSVIGVPIGRADAMTGVITGGGSRGDVGATCGTFEKPVDEGEVAAGSPASDMRDKRLGVPLIWPRGERAGASEGMGSGDGV